MIYASYVVQAYGQFYFLDKRAQDSTLATRRGRFLLLVLVAALVDEAVNYLAVDSCAESILLVLFHDRGR